MDLDAQNAETRRKAAQEREQRELPLPPGVTMVKLNKQVTGLRVGPDGLATLAAAQGPWQPIGRPVGVKRGKVIHSRVRIKLDNGSKLTARPYLPKEKGVADAGQRDSLYRGGSSDPNDFIVAIFLMIVLIIVVIPALYLAVREVAGLSPRCKLAAQLMEQIKAAMTPGKP